MIYNLINHTLFRRPSEQHPPHLGPDPVAAKWNSAITNVFNYAGAFSCCDTSRRPQYETPAHVRVNIPSMLTFTWHWLSSSFHRDFLVPCGHCSRVNKSSLLCSRSGSRPQKHFHCLSNEPPDYLWLWTAPAHMSYASSREEWWDAWVLLGIVLRWVLPKVLGNK